MKYLLRLIRASTLAINFNQLNIAKGAFYSSCCYRDDFICKNSTRREINTTNDGSLNNDNNYVSLRSDKNTLTELPAKRHSYFSETDIEHLLQKDVSYRSCKKRSLLDTVQMLCLAGIVKQNFLDYPWLLTLEKRKLEQKLQMLQQIPFIQDINHFVPFLRLTLRGLQRLITRLNAEANIIPYGNRVYYISEKLNMDTNLVSKYLSKRLFILEMPFEMFEKNLQHMINYNVNPKNVLRDLWAFRYTPQVVQLRLERARRAKKEKIMPWMVRCPESIFQRSLKLSMDELRILGDKSTVIEYVAQRLNFSVDETKAIMAKHPQVNHVRVTKIKEVMDYLLDEAGFSRYEIAQVPRILCHGLKTTKFRMEELKSYGCRPSSLVILCRSTREYKRFLEEWIVKKKKKV